MCIRDSRAGGDEAQPAGAAEIQAGGAAEILPLRLHRGADAPGPVSYTHLDVYKRQVHDLTNFGFRDMVKPNAGAAPIALPKGMGNIHSVSYTHLDVYKRQAEGKGLHPGLAGLLRNCEYEDNHARMGQVAAPPV